MYVYQFFGGTPLAPLNLDLERKMVKLQLFDIRTFRRALCLEFCKRLKVFSPHTCRK